MAPDQYTREFALPTLEEALSHLSDRRRAVLACMTAWHVVDYLKAGGIHTAQAELDARGLTVEASVVQGVCNGTKHVGPARHGIPFKAGDDIVAPAFAWDTPGAGWDQGAYDEPAVAVDHDGQRYVLTETVRKFLAALKDAFPSAITDPIP